ncbi:MAG TPA: ATP-binding protein [Steroidobacteraceae bacterium]|nr:ATP-binding protein [Steroidobacteraceae bacterium]
MLATSTVPRDHLEQLEFLLGLSDHLRCISDPIEIQLAAVRLLGERLGVDRVGYAEIDSEGEALRILGEWRRPGIAALLGSWKVEAATQQVSAIDDALVEPQAVAQLIPPSQAALDIRSAVVYRLVRQAQMVAALYVHQTSPRHWTESEISLIGETGERTWQAVEQARSLAQLRQSEQKYRRLFNSIDEGFCIIEVLFDSAQHVLDYRYLETNIAFERHTGLHNAVGRRARELTPQLEQHWFDVYGRIARSGEPARFELPAASLGHWYEVYAFRVGEPQQRRVAIIFDDITQRVMSEAALRESERRCRTLAADSTRLLDAERVARCEVDRAMHAKDEFLVTVSHELRTPLANIVAWSRLLRTQFVKDEQMLQKGLAVISENAVSLGRLISGLMDSCRLTNGKFELEPEALDLNELLASVHASMLPSVEGRGITLAWHPLPGPAPIQADGTRLRQVVDNLLSNAVKFTPRGGTISLSCAKPDAGRYTIEVRDTGQGIDASLLPHVFDRFRQADFARSRGYGGLGLGLSIARQIVELHGGTIRAESEGRGLGSRFVVTLPERVGSASGHNVEVTPASPGVHSLGGVRVLVVEDQAEMREVLKRILEEHGAQVTAVGTAAEALTRLREAKPGGSFDVLVSDIGLPALDGNQFLRIVRHELGLDASQLPAVAVTAYTRLEDRKRALDAGFQEHLTKPYSPNALVTLIHRLVAENTSLIAAN